MAEVEAYEAPGAAAGQRSSGRLRQKFAGHERDSEPGLDYVHARYYAGAQGRFTGVDPPMNSDQRSNPQTWNRYSYGLNNPLRYIDPTGMFTQASDVTQGEESERLSRQRTQQQTDAYTSWLEEIRKKAEPLPEGVQPVAAELLYEEGEAVTYSGQRVSYPDGRPATRGSAYGVLKFNAFVIVDQASNIMGPDAGVTFNEAIKPESDDAKKLAADGELLVSNPSDRFAPNKDGVFFDRIGGVFPTFQAAKDNKAKNVVVSQSLTFYQSRPAVFRMNNTHQVSGGKIVSKMGEIRRFHLRK